MNQDDFDILVQITGRVKQGKTVAISIPKCSEFHQISLQWELNSIEVVWLNHMLLFEKVLICVWVAVSIFQSSSVVFSEAHSIDLIQPSLKSIVKFPV